MKKVLSFIILFVLIFSFTGCDDKTTTDVANTPNDTTSTSSKYDIDYSDAKSFESALNDGAKVKGKIVRFDVIEYKPNSAMGINCWSGEHLNFISENELDVDKGDIVVGRITREPSKSFGSWKVPYEVLDIEGKKIENNSSTTTDNQSPDGNKNDNGSNDTKNFKVGDEIILGDVKFNIYKIGNDNKTLHLLAQNNVAITTFSDSERPYDEEHNYEGSLVEGFVNKFVDDLEDKGYTIKSSGIIDKDDLYELGFIDSVTVSGRPYLCKNTPDFVKLENNYWLGGYYRVDTYQWVYFDEKIDTKSCEDEYGVRPTIVIDSSEIDKKPQSAHPNLTIREIVNSKSAWTSEGGIHNPYDRFYFDCEKMLFTNVFSSSALNRTDDFDMKFIDDKTIQVDGLMRGYNYPAQITIVSETKLRIRFLDEKYNDGDYYLVKEN